uniref:Uncharacterized protein n=1 Tax=Arundo donax TaxID=35708 RepID=A0A0A9QRY7_ARUDO
MEESAAVGGSGEPAANWTKPEEQQFDPSRSKDLSTGFAPLRFCRF